MGTLFYVVGASGAGKDSLLAYARAALGGGAPVFITNIQKLADGRIAFDIGSEFQ